MTTRDCRLSSSWSFDSAYCLSLRSGSTSLNPYTLKISGKVTTGTITTSAYYRDGIDGVWPPTTEYDRCVPGDSNCSIFDGNACPSPYSKVSYAEDVAASKSTSFCCLSGATLLVNPYTYVYSGKTSTSSQVPMCVHKWDYWAGDVDPSNLFLGSYTRRDSGTTTYPSVVNWFTMRARGVASSIESTSTTPSPSGIGISTPTPSPTLSTPLNTSTPPPSSNPDPGSLSTNTKIGIGVGVGIGALVLISGIFAIFFLLRRRRNKKGIHQKLAQDEADMMDKPELPANSLTEIDGQGAAKMEGQGGHEMDGTGYSELDAWAPTEMEGRTVNELAAESHPVEMADTSVPVKRNSE